MSEPTKKKSSYAKAYVVLGIGAGVGLGLCGVGLTTADSSSGLLHSAATIAFSIGTILFWASILGIVILSVILVVIFLSGANRE